MEQAFISPLDEGVKVNCDINHTNYHIHFGIKEDRISCVLNGGYAAVTWSHRGSSRTPDRKSRMPLRNLVGSSYT